MGTDRVLGAQRSALRPVLGLMLAAVVLSGCLLPPAPSSTRLIYDADGPDPSWVPIYYGVAEVYTTDATIAGGHWAHVPTYTTIVNSSSTAPTDALPTLPTLTSGDIWAPSVRGMDGQYVMVFSESVSGRANCIGWATSPNATVFTPDNEMYWCSSNPSVGYLDPYIFVDAANATVWLIYSQQGAALTSADGSQIVIHQMNADGLGFPGGSEDFTLVTYAQASALNASPGSNPEIENPSMTIDSGYFDLTFSLGTWTSNSTYVTGEIPCLSNSSGCIPSQGLDIMGGDGGASALLDGSPVTNWLIWHTWSGSNRVDQSGPTSEASSSTSPTASKNPNARSAQAGGALPIAATQTPTQVLPQTWKPRVSNPEEPNLMIGYDGPPTTMSPGSPPVSGPLPNPTHSTP